MAAIVAKKETRTCGPVIRLKSSRDYPQTRIWLITREGEEYLAHLETITCDFWHNVLSFETDNYYYEVKA